MIAVNIYYKGIPGNARAFVNEMTLTGTVDKIRSVKGNLQYEYFFPYDNDEVVLLIDKWENQEALDIHHASPMMQFIIDLREKYDLRMTVERYISDDENKDIDKEFIRE